MLKFTNHALKRLSERRYDSKINDRRVLKQLARESFLDGQMITAEEAAEIIGGFVCRKCGDFFYRSDGTGRGVWVALLACKTKNEIVLTYLAPGDQLDNNMMNKLVFSLGDGDQDYSA